MQGMPPLLRLSCAASPPNTPNHPPKAGTTNILSEELHQEMKAAAEAERAQIAANRAEASGGLIAKG